MKAEARSLWHLATTAVQKNKRFEVMPKVTRADQASDKTMLLTVGAKNNLARAAHKLSAHSYKAGATLKYASRRRAYIATASTVLHFF